MKTAIASIGLSAVLAVSACAPSSASSSGNTAAAKHAGDAAVNRPVPNVCARGIVAPSDLAGVLPGTITTKTIAGDPQTCEFSTPDFSSVTVTVRPGLGDVTVAQWAGGKMPVSSASIGGIGDRAVWQDTLHELIATKHNVLCDIGSQGTRRAKADLRKTFAQLCDKIWAAQ